MSQAEIGLDAEELLGTFSTRDFFTSPRFRNTDRTKHPIRRYIDMCDYSQKAMMCLVLGTVCLGLTACDRTESDWKAARQANTVMAYEGFLDKHSQGRHVDECRQAIDGLAWKETQTRNTIDAFKAYLTKHPQGRYRDEAKSGIEEAGWSGSLAAMNAKWIRTCMDKYPQSMCLEQAKSSLRHIEDADWATCLRIFHLYRRDCDCHAKEGWRGLDSGPLEVCKSSQKLECS